MNLCGTVYIHEHGVPDNTCTLSEDHGGDHMDDGFHWKNDRLPVLCEVQGDNKKCLLRKGHRGPHREGKNVWKHCGPDCTLELGHSGPHMAYTKPHISTYNDDEVSKPAHYTHGKIETIDVIEDWKLNFNLGNTVKYVSRANHKGTRLKDLKKARWYLDREITNEEKICKS